MSDSRILTELAARFPGIADARFGWTPEQRRIFSDDIRRMMRNHDLGTEQVVARLDYLARTVDKRSVTPAKVLDSMKALIHDVHVDRAGTITDEPTETAMSADAKRASVAELKRKWSKR